MTYAHITADTITALGNPPVEAATHGIEAAKAARNKE